MKQQTKEKTTDTNETMSKALEKMMESAGTNYNSPNCTVQLKDTMKETMRETMRETMKPTIKTVRNKTMTLKMKGKTKEGSTNLDDVLVPAATNTAPPPPMATTLTPPPPMATSLTPPPSLPTSRTPSVAPEVLPWPCGTAINPPAPT